MSSLGQLPSPLLELSRSLKKKESVPKQVEHVLREMIFTGALKAGERIVETKIARQLEIGQATVREALNTLEAERLVVRFPNRGCRVAALSTKEINQSFRLRIELEALVVELAIENRSQWHPEPWLGVVKNMKKAAQENDFEAFYQWDLEFHKLLWQFADNPFLEAALSQTTMPLFPFVFMKLFSDGALDLKLAAADHERIARAVITEKKKQAKQIVRAVVGSYWNDVMALLNARQEAGIQAVSDR
ncbi:MAG: GntR family transcriptional regulator [Acidobacteriota bacterium]